MVKLDLVHELNVLDAGDAELPASPMQKQVWMC
jgi:hypothetical protein